MPPTDAPPPQEFQIARPIDFRGFYYTMRERAWILALCCLVAAFATAAYLLRTPKIFASKVVLQVEQEEAKIINIQRVQQEDLQTLEFLKTVEQTLQNRTLLERVIATNQLANDPGFVPSGSGNRSSEQLVTKLSKMVEVKLRKGTRLIDVKVEHPRPELTALIANSLVKEYIRQCYENNFAASEIAKDYLVNEANGLKRKLEESENALQAYREQAQSISFEDRQNIVVEKLKELSLKATEASSQRIVQETAWKQVQALGTNLNALLLLPAVASDPRISEIRANLGRQESEVATLKQRYLERHPKLIQAQSQLAEWKSALEKAVLGVPETIRSAYESSKAAERALEQALREQETLALDLNKQTIRYQSLAREVESDRTLYASVLNRTKETSLTKDLKLSKIRIVQHARVPEKPVKPDKLTVIILGTLAGLGGGLLLALFHNALDRSLKTVDQTEEYLGLPVLSAIPKFTSDVAHTRNLITNADTHSSEAESFRTLRTALSMLGRKEDRKVFLFTSAVPAEGKTFCSINYALILAQQGLRTLVIDCDLRRPMVEKTLMSNNKRGFGLTDYLTGQKTFQEVAHATETENLFYIPAGSDAPNPAELLAKTGIDALVDESLAQYDRVVIDSAPIHAVSDTLLILNRIQTLCLVVRARRTPKNSVRRAVLLLREAEAPLAGVVLNLLPRSRNTAYYYDSYYSYSYYGKYYSQKKTVPA